MWIQTGSVRFAWTKALLKSIEQVCHPNVGARQETIGLKSRRQWEHRFQVFLVQGCLKLSCALCTGSFPIWGLLAPIIPSPWKNLGLGFKHTDFYSRLATSLAAASIHLVTCSMSAIAWSKLKVSGSDAAALKAVWERMMPSSSKIQALGDAKYPWS